MEEDSRDIRTTVRAVVDLVVELGLVDPSTPTRQTPAAQSLDEPLSYYGHTEQNAVLNLLGELGIRYTFDYKTFRGIAECNDHERRAWYESELQSIAACSRGMVIITNVRLVEDDTTWELRFDSNGVTESWTIYPGDDEEDIEASIEFATSVTQISTGVAERFCSVDPRDENSSGEAVFGDPEALNQLGAHFGLTFKPALFWRPVKQATIVDSPDPTSDALTAWLEKCGQAFPQWAQTYGGDWDFSPDSLSALEELVRRTTPTAAELNDPSHRRFRDSAAWYLGEAMRRGMGGHWNYDDRIDDERNFPYLEQLGPWDSIATPVIGLENALTQRGYLRAHYENFAS